MEAIITTNLPPENMIKVISTGNVFSKIINLEGKRLKFESAIKLPKFDMCPYCGRMLLRAVSEPEGSETYRTIWGQLNNDNRRKGI